MSLGYHLLNIEALIPYEDVTAAWRSNRENWLREVVSVLGGRAGPRDEDARAARCSDGRLHSVPVGLDCEVRAPPQARRKNRAEREGGPGRAPCFVKS